MRLLNWEASLPGEKRSASVHNIGTFRCFMSCRHDFAQLCLLNPGSTRITRPSLSEACQRWLGGESKARAQLKVVPRLKTCSYIAKVGAGIMTSVPHVVWLCPLGESCATLEGELQDCRNPRALEPFSQQHRTTKSMPWSEPDRQHQQHCGVFRKPRSSFLERFQAPSHW